MDEESELTRQEKRRNLKISAAGFVVGAVLLVVFVILQSQ